MVEMLSTLRNETSNQASNHIINYVLKMKSMKIKKSSLQVYYLYAIVPASTTHSNTTQNTVVTMVVT